MNERHREILRKARPKLVDVIVSVDSICDSLRASDVLTEDMTDEITLKGTRARMVRALLDIIPRRGKNAYDNFYQALVETSNQQAADILKPELAVITPEQKLNNSEFEPEHKPGSTNDKLTKLQKKTFSEKYEDNLIFNKAASRSEAFNSKQDFEETIAQQPFESSNVDKLSVQQSLSVNNTPHPVQPENSYTSAQVSPLVCDKEMYNQTEENSYRSSLQNNTSSCQEESTSNTGTWSMPDPVPMHVEDTSHVTEHVWISQTDEHSKPKLGTQESCNEDDLDLNWPSSDEHTSLMVKLKETASENIKYLIENEKAYDLSKTKFTNSGRVIIINNDFCKIYTENSPKLPERKNARSDYTKSSQLFKALKFRTETFANKSYEEIDLVLKKAQAFDYSDHGCLIVVIMSHGKGKNIYCNDGREMNIDYILGLFTDENCPSLKDKPKLFFIQACQARTTDSKELDSLEDFDRLVYTRAVSMELTDSVQQTDSEQPTDAAQPVGNDATVQQDMFIARATADEQASYQNGEFGGKFIWAFAYVIQELSHEKDLLVIMKMVNKLLSDEKSDIPAVQCTHSLRKKLYLCAYDKIKQR